MFGKKVGVIGTGGWGTALAVLLALNDHKVTMYSYEEDTKEEINKRHTNRVFLPGIKLPSTIIATNNLKKLKRSDFYLLATPTQYIRPLVDKKNLLNTDIPIISVSKGIEINSLMRVSEILADVLDYKKEKFAVLTGPSHAEEVARATPTTVVVGSENPSLSKEVQDLFTNDSFRVYSSEDVIGCELGGSLKNVIAIAAGIIDGLHFGDNTKAALITRALAEMTRVGLELGANPLTFSGLSGLGDLMVTCNSVHSRNHRVGEMIAQGKTIQQIMDSQQTVAEGVTTTKSAYELSKKINVEMPITEQIYKILFQGTSPSEAMNTLMTRQLTSEIWS